MTNAHDVDLRCIVVDVVEHDVPAPAEHDDANVRICGHLGAHTDAWMRRDVQQRLLELYYAGETLIVEYLEYRNEYGFWHRHEWWSIVGHEPEYWEVRCEGSRDATPMMLPGRDDGCALCRNDEAHTVELQRDVTRVGALRSTRFPDR